MRLPADGRRPRSRIAAAAALLLAALAACSGPAEPEAPLPALSRPGMRWQVTRGDKAVFSMANASGRVDWGSQETDHPFLTGEVLDAKEETRLRLLLKKSRNFRDFVNQLGRAGYGVSAAAP
ncbi:MAG: hypothetical protein HY554_12120 [Elusimicrobia bacterium]|nr:hypothetical protein [Elusimicrobiota bacterium]